ncbi:hypothetical protein HDE_06618 [Halotydeus destructor]|nr:hypothetical protein HDE_06618 [Halotydeus destructor]
MEALARPVFHHVHIHEQHRISSKKFTPIILSLCVIGAVHQCRNVTMDYTRYEVVSHISLSKPTEIVPPAFSLCLEYVDLLDWTLLLPGAKFEEGPLKRRQIEQAVQETVPIATILASLPNLTSDGALRHMMSRVPGTYDTITGVDALKIERFIKNYYGCYMFSMAAGRNVTLQSRHVTYGHTPGSLMTVTLTKEDMSKISRAIFYLNPADLLPRGDRDFRLSMDAKGVSVFSQVATYWSISYQHIQLKLLPSPFTTNCRDFRSIGFEGNHHCQLACTHQYAVRNYGKSLFTLIHDKPLNYAVISKYSVVGNETLGKQLSEWEAICDKKCLGITCDKNFYAPKIDSQLDHDTDIVFRIVEPSGVFIRSEFKPMISWNNFLVSILSLLGVWFGFSFVTVIKLAYTNSKAVVVKFSH